jgi:DNA polymerase I-like protein with 3'-5' exonuclease and polymerase domains
MKKEYRKLMKPNNDLFISLDYNGAEIRTLLELSGMEQPQEDIHIWNSRHLFEQEIDREEAKVRFFAWLYDPQSNDIETKLYDKKSLLDKWYVDGYIKTPYMRKIKVEERKAFNYLIQSTTADRVLSKAVEIDKMLENTKSYISHIVHDEIIIDYDDRDRSLMPDIKEVFEDGYVSNIKGGKSYFDLEAMDI